MRLSRTLPAFALLALTASIPLFTASAATAPAHTTAKSVADDSPLHEAMETLKGGQRTLKKLIGDPVTNEAELMKTLREMEDAVVSVLGEKPEAPEEMTGKALDLYNIGYRAEMAKLLQQLLSMQTSTLNADVPGLKAGYDALGETKKSGHDNFRVDD